MNEIELDLRTIPIPSVDMWVVKNHVIISCANKKHVSLWHPVLAKLGKVQNVMRIPQPTKGARKITYRIGVICNES